MKQKIFFGIGTILVAVLFLMAKCNPEKECTPCEDPDCPGCDSGECTAVTPPANDGYTANFPDGQFEVGFKTDVVDNVEFDNYSSDLLRTINDLYALSQELGGPGPITTSKACSQIDGRYALELKTGFLPGFTHDGVQGVLIPGAIGTISDNFINEFLDNNGAIGTKKPFAYKPAALKGYMQYSPVSGDSAAIEVVIYNGSNEIGRGKLITKSAVNSFTLFEVPITYAPETNTLSATHLTLIMSASAAYNFNDLLNCKGQVGSTLYIDRLWWKL